MLVLSATLMSYVVCMVFFWVFLVLLETFDILNAYMFKFCVLVLLSLFVRVIFMVV